MVRRYVIPRFPGLDLGWVRIGGSGLGNLLFVWARALVRSIETGAELVSPVWHQIKIGPWLRGEADKRSYLDVFPLRPATAVWTDLVRCRLRGHRVNRLSAEITAHSGVEYEIVDDGRPCFHDLEPYREAIRAALIRAARPSVLPKQDERPTVAVHVRLGDFARPQVTAPQFETNTSFPLAWYISAIDSLRDRLDLRDETAIVFSDGKDEELAPLLRLPKIRRARKRSALHDLLTLSNAKYIIGSHSTFTFWAAFLGAATLVMPSGFPYHKYFSAAFSAMLDYDYQQTHL